MSVEFNHSFIQEIRHLRKSLKELSSKNISPIREKEFKLLFENLSSGFSYHDVIFDNLGNAIDCRYIAVNKRFEEILGFKRKKIIGKTFSEIQNGELEPFWMEIYGKVAKTGKVEKFEEYSKLINKHLEITAYSPQYGKFVTIFNDITEKKNQESALLKQVLVNETLATIAKKLLSSNNSTESISKYILEKITSITNSEHGFISIIEPHKKIQCTSCNLLNNAEILTSNYSFENENFNKDCILHFLSTSRKHTKNISKNSFDFYCNKKDIQIKINDFISTPIFINEKIVGQIVLANSKLKFSKEDVGNISKISDIFALSIQRKEIEDELVKSKQKAEESDRLKTTFLENMSHEIRTPMNGIIGFADLLKDSNLNFAQRKEYISYIDNSCKVLTNIIDDIIDISKIEVGQLSIFKSSFLLTELMNELEIQFNEDKIRKNKTDVNIKYINENSSNYYVYTDKNRLSQVFYNLMSNALKFTNKGTIEFGYKLKNKSDLLFFVKDSGIGIPKDKQKIIFERFRQVDESQQRSFGGAGLGLAISKNLVKLLGGNIKVESKLNVGTTFYFEIKNIIEKSAHNEISVFNSSKYPDWNNKKILIVEDNTINFRLLKEIFKNTNAEILWANNGNKSIELINNEKHIDLILMDIVLPDISGYDAFVEIRKYHKKIPVIAQTALAMLEEKNKIEDAGFDGYVTKPIKSSQLFDEINKVFLSKK